MSTISGLSVRISSEVAQFEAGMSGAQESAEDLSFSLRQMSAATNSSERGLNSLGRGAQEIIAEITALSRQLESIRTDLLEVGSSGTIAAQAVDHASDEMGDLSRDSIQTAAALEILSGRADSAERSIDSTGRSATTTAAQFGALSAGTDGLSVSFMGLSGTMLLTLIPAFLTLSTIIAPLVGLLGGFATLVGAIGFVGLAGLIGGIATNTEAFKQELQLLASTLREELGPVFDTFAAAALTVMRDFRRSIDQLVPSQAVIQQIAADFVNLGRAVIDALPALIDLAVTLTEDFLPGFVTFAEDVLPEVPGLLRGFVGSMETASEILSPLVDDFAAFIPVVTEFGENVLRVIVPAIGRLTRMATRAMRGINDMDSGLQSLVISGLILLPLLTGLVGFLGGPLTAILGVVGGAFAGLAALILSDFGGVRTLMEDMAPTMRDVGSAIQSTIGTFTEALDLETITAELQEFEQIVGEELQKNLPVSRKLLSNFADMLRDNQEEFRLFGEVAGDILVGIIDTLGMLAKIGGFVFRNIFAPGVTFVIDLVDVLLTKLANAIRLFRALESGDFGQAAGLATEVAFGEDTQLPRPPEAFAGQQEIRVVLDENTEFVEAKIQDGAQQVYQQENQNQYEIAQNLGNRAP